MNKLIAWIIVLVLVVWGVFDWAKGGSTPKETGPIKIGLITPLSGDAASLGEFIKNVTDLAVAEINANGGIDGREITVIAEDDKCNSATAVSAAQELIQAMQIKEKL